MISVVDLFAGPGGLGEGFSAYKAPDGSRPFKIRLSVEKEKWAHRTLLLRAFLRQFGDDSWPEAYWDYLDGKISRRQLFRARPPEYKAALNEVFLTGKELGKHNRIIDIRLNRALKSNPDDQWVVIGGPPCQAYSLVGRSRNKGNAKYLPEADHRNFLYKEYLRVIARVRPAVFVMENVKGMLSAKVQGESIFDAVLQDLANPSSALGKSAPRGEACEYTIHSLSVSGDDPAPADFVVKSEQHGVPQSRHRVILLGVRSDISRRPKSLRRAAREVNVGEVLAGLPLVRGRVSRRGLHQGAVSEDWVAILEEALQSMLDAPERRVPASVKEVAREAFARSDPSLPSRATEYVGRGPAFPRSVPNDLRDWLKGRSKRLTGHESRSHMAKDLQRYFFAACWARANSGRSPVADDYTDDFEPDHANWKSGKFADRFRVQAEGRPSSTVTSHISKDGHYYIHPNPELCRSLTPREAARLQTFPDDYFFEGSRTSQFVQIGNAVPPYLANQIAAVVEDVIF